MFYPQLILVGDPKAIVENCLEFSPIQMWYVLLNFYCGTLGSHYFFNWRIIALQCCSGLSHTST